MKLSTSSIAKLKGVHPDLVRVVQRCAAEWNDKTLKGELMTLSAGVPASAALNALNMVGKQLALMSVEKDVMAEVLAARDRAIAQAGGKRRYHKTRKSRR